MDKLTNIGLARGLIAGLSLGMWLIGVAPATAVPIFDVNFNTDTVGLPPTATGPINHPTSTYSSGSDTVTVTADQLGLTRPVEMINVATDGQSYPWIQFNSPFTITEGIVTARWDSAVISTGAGASEPHVSLQIVDLAQSQYLVTKFINGSDYYGAGVNFDGYVITEGLYGAGGSFNGYANAAIDYGTTNHFEMVLDLDYNTYSFSKDGVNLGSAAMNMANVQYFWFRSMGIGLGPTDRTFDFVLDNFQIDYTVPEPSFMALVGVGGLLLLRRRRG